MILKATCLIILWENGENIGAVPVTTGSKEPRLLASPAIIRNKSK